MLVTSLIVGIYKITKMWPENDHFPLWTTMLVDFSFAVRGGFQLPSYLALAVIRVHHEYRRILTHSNACASQCPLLPLHPVELLHHHPQPQRSLCPGGCCPCLPILCSFTCCLSETTATATCHIIWRPSLSPLPQDTKAACLSLLWHL